MDSPLLTKSKQFALDIIKVCNKVKSEKWEVYLQINLFAVVQAQVQISEKRFTDTVKTILLLNCKQLLKNVLKVNTGFELLIESGYYDDESILENCIELKKILISSINTAKKNNNQSRHLNHSALPKQKSCRKIGFFCFVLFSFFKPLF